MSLIKVDYGSVGGGTGVTNGTFNIADIGQEHSFNTGISSPSKVVIFGPKLNSGTRFNYAEWVSTDDTHYYSYYGPANTGAIITSTALGTASNTNCIKLKSVQNGVVTFDSPTNSNGAYEGDYYWYAEP